MVIPPLHNLMSFPFSLICPHYHLWPHACGSLSRWVFTNFFHHKVKSSHFSCIHISSVIWTKIYYFSGAYCLWLSMIRCLLRQKASLQRSWTEYANQSHEISINEGWEKFNFIFVQRIETRELWIQEDILHQCWCSENYWNTNHCL